MLIVSTKAAWDDARAVVKSGNKVSAKWNMQTKTNVSSSLKTLGDVNAYARAKKIERALSEEEMERYSNIIPVVITKMSEDRAEDVVDMETMDIETFETNPVMLFAHDQITRPVIGNGLMTSKQGDEVHSLAAFTNRDLNPEGHMIGRLYEAKIMRGISIGFISDAEMRVNEDGEFVGMKWTNPELVEYSAVPVPMHRSALAQAKSLNIDLSPMRDRVVKELDTAGLVGVKREDLERVWKMLRTGKQFASSNVGELVDEVEKKMATARSAERNAAAAAIRKAIGKSTTKGADDAVKVTLWRRAFAAIAPAVPKALLLDAIKASEFDADEEAAIEEADKEAEAEIKAAVEAEDPAAAAGDGAGDEHADHEEGKACETCGHVKAAADDESDDENADEAADAEGDDPADADGGESSGDAGSVDGSESAEEDDSTHTDASEKALIKALSGNTGVFRALQSIAKG